jgi:putative hydrolase of the HAD superfamily
MIMAAQITTLFLDIGGVLLTNGWDHHMRRRAAEKFALDWEEMNERHNMTFDTYEVGKLSLGKYLDRVVFYARRPFSPEEFSHYMFAESQALPGMIDFFTQLKRTYRLTVAAVSNEGRELTEHRVKAFELNKLMDFFICSAFVHFRKPDEDIYRLALDTAQARPEQVVYVDDRQMFVEVARGLGIHGIHHQGLHSTKTSLAEFGLPS